MPAIKSASEMGVAESPSTEAAISHTTTLSR